MRTTVKRRSDVDRLYQLAVARAVDAAGGERAFQIIGPTFRQALVSHEILIILNSQDEAIPDATVRRLMEGLRDAVRDDETLIGGIGS
jgi:hypothetical protein